MKERYRLTIAYDGTNYSGWQIQPNAPSIQEQLQNALEVLLHHKCTVIAAGRTDAGVHAKAQVAHFDSSESIDPLKFLKSLNGILPIDIRVKTFDKARPDFHARFSAKGKIYHYYFTTNVVSDPFRRLYSLHLKGSFDKKRLA